MSGLGPQVELTTIAVTFNGAAALVYSPPALAVPPHFFLRILNVSALGAATIWFTRSNAIGLNVAPNLAGCFFLEEFIAEVWKSPDLIPTNSIWAIGPAGAALTIEYG